MKNKLLTCPTASPKDSFWRAPFRRAGGIIALVLCIGGLLAMANPTKQPEQKPDVLQTKEGDLNAKKALSDAFEKTNKSKGYHFSGKGEAHYVEMGMTIPAEFNGVASNPDNLLHMVYQTKVMGGAKKYELYQKDDKKYTRNVASKKWAEGNALSPIIQSDRIKSALEGYKFGKDEKLNECDHSIIEATINEKDASELLSELPKTGALSAETKITCNKTRFKIWVDKKTSLISKMYFFVEVTAAMPGEETPKEGQESTPKSGQKMSVDIIIYISDYDKDIEITVPDEIKKVLDAKNKQLKNK